MGGLHQGAALSQPTVDWLSGPLQNGKISSSLYDAILSEELVDAAIRLLGTLDSPSEAKILGALYKK